MHASAVTATPVDGARRLAQRLCDVTRSWWWYDGAMTSPCPICKAEVVAGRPENPHAPFCSARCKTVDLGRWLGGAYTLPMRDEAPGEADLAQVLGARGDA